MSKAYVVLCRHGKRAPGRLLDSGDIERWAPITFKFNEVSALEDLHAQFPVYSQTINSRPHDELHHPFGSLTSMGAIGMRSIGQKLALRFPDLLEDKYQYVAHSTNYRRTQLSAQFLLQGVVNACTERIWHVQGQILVESSGRCPLTFYESFPAIADVVVRKVLQSEAYKAAASAPQVQSAVRELTRLFPPL
eukprot:gene43774-53532_t